MNQQNKCLICVTAGRWQLHGIIQAKEMGLKVLAIDSDDGAEGFAASDYQIVHDFSDPEGIFEKMRSLNIEFSGVISFCSEAGMHLAALIRCRFGLVGPDITMTKKLTNKISQRLAWEKDQVPGPVWQGAASSDEAYNKALKMELPFIIKPSDSAGSRGVVKIENRQDIKLSLIEDIFKFSKSGSIILEAYMNGDEYTVETYTSGGKTFLLAITQKSKVEGTSGTVASELRTARLDTNSKKLLYETVLRAINSIGYTDGVAHSEVILMPDGKIGMVELAGRGGGFLLSEKFVPSVSGVNTAKLSILSALGVQIDQINVSEKVGILRFFPSVPGKFLSVDGLELAKSQVGVDCGCFLTSGQVMTKAKADGDRMGYILAAGSDYPNVQAAVDRAEAMIHFNIERI